MTEMLSEFVRREGPVSTRYVAIRFRIGTGEARRRLKRLQKMGLLRRWRDALSKASMWEVADAE